MGREDWLLAESIAKELERAETALDEVDNLIRIGAANNDDPEDDRYQTAEQTMVYYIDRAYRSIAALSERLGITTIAKEVVAARADKDFLSRTDRTNEGDIHSAALSKAQSCFDPLKALTSARAVTAQDVLRTILHSSGKIAAARSTPPKNEADVRNAVLEVCGFAFNDAMRETPVAKRLTGYRIDLTVRSLRSAVEFKFIDKKSEMRAAIEGVYADMKGYRHPDWDSFYSVFYMTSPFYTQAEVDEEFRYVDADKSWEPIVVQGPGRRKPRVSKA
ncbi:hypothetical protein VPH47_01240 [Stenotrophomonas sp. WED208]|jgi:hypothetical protein|uniref:hypothetical protein n=1 Tax=Stenotrophomonas sp. WED208 TaxID=3112800 RepID=UPI0034D743B9